jgi:tetratricopeptide (TPR) repeat protein
LCGRVPEKRYPNSLEATRIDVLKQLLEQNPTSTFARYGLAMEYVKAGELETAIAEFKAVAAADSAYSAAFFQGGQTLEKLGRLSDARGFYREGIAKTRDEHARSEMQAALDLLGPDAVLGPDD